MSQSPPIKLAPNIWKTASGYRVFVRVSDSRTGRSRLAPKRFKDDGRPEREQLADLKYFRDAAKLEAARVRRQEPRRPAAPVPADPLFAADAECYLGLETTKTMPSSATQVRRIRHWIAIFGDRVRRTITAPEIDNELQQLLGNGYSGSTVNKFRTALMAMYTALDGRGAANPVKDTRTFEEAELTARGQSYDLLERILALIPEERGVIDRARIYEEVWREPMRTIAPRYGVSNSYLKRVCRRLDVPTPPRGYWAQPVAARPAQPSLPANGTNIGRVPSAAKARALLEALAWTGMDPSQLMRMNPKTSFSVAQGWYVTPPRRKGTRRRKTPRPVFRKPLSEEAARAFQRLTDLRCWGPFDRDWLRRVWYRAIGRLEPELRIEYRDPRFALPHIRLKDIRHSFGTALYERLAPVKGERSAQDIVGQMLDHAPGSHETLRYTLGAVPSALRAHVKRFPQRRRDARKDGVGITHLIPPK